MGLDYSQRRFRGNGTSRSLGAALLWLLVGGSSYALVSDAEFTALQRQVEAIRGLTFKHPVPYEVLNKEQLVHNLSAEVDHETNFPEYEAFLKSFGFVPPDYPVRASILKLYGEQVGGYYAPETGKFYLCSDTMAAVGSGGEDQLAKSMGISMEDVTIAHELTHALQDQYFDLRKIEHGVDAASEDVQLAVSALFEGDATVVMLEQPMRKLGVDPSMLGDISSMLDSGMGTPASFPEFNKAPLFFQRSMVFPYIKGYHYVSVLRQQGGWDAVNAHYTHLPATPAEILEPGQSHVPVPIKLPSVSVSGWTSATTGTLGQYLTGVWLEQYEDGHPAAATAVSRWRGDTYQVYADGHQHRFLVWDSRWADARSAQAFYDQAIRALPHRRDGEAYDAQHSSPDRMVWQASGTLTSAERKDSDVLILDAIPTDAFDTVSRAVVDRGAPGEPLASPASAPAPP